MEFKKEAYATWSNDATSLSYLFYKTKDNSISVSLKSETVSTELMHSVDGAFSETIYLYEDIVKYAAQLPLQNNSCIFLSLGLGLGYVEILICAYMFKHYPHVKFKIFSFEKEPELRVFFKKFIFDENDIPSIFKDSYNHIFNLFSQYYELSSLELKTFIKNSNIIFYEEYNLLTEVNEPINGLFFDAFSINTSPELWADDLINKILGSCHEHAAFATYAARTHLKRLLMEHGFKLEKKKGYGGKKESTFAFR
ncbi:MAG: MnmC family methyltransferase [Bdellovibrionota bacterium]